MALLKSLIATTLCALFGLGCAPSPAIEGRLPDRDAALAHRLVAEEGALLLDVRTEGEYNARHLPGAKLLPIQRFARDLPQIAAWTKGKDTPIVLYCRSGARASTARRILEREGYTRVTNLGAMTAW